jgi:translation elongation factor EF-1alpha
MNNEKEKFNMYIYGHDKAGKTLIVHRLKYDLNGISQR